MKIDILVIGSGTSGYTVANGLKKEGKTVAVADRRSFGGTCAKRGCQPKKYLVANAEIVHLAKGLEGKGLKKAPSVAWKDLMSLKREFTDKVSFNTEEGFKTAGIDVLHGDVYFTSPQSVIVGDLPVSADKIVLAVGTIPTPLTIPGGDFTVDSEYFLDMDKMPRKIIFIGGGYISFELASVAHQAGAETIILHRSVQPLKHFDPDLTRILVKTMKEEGLNLYTEHPVKKIEKSNSGFKVIAGVDEYFADLVVNATGRTPDLNSLNLDVGNIKFGAKGIDVNDYLQSSSNPNVFAVGDCVASGPDLATVADMQAEIVVQNILNKDSVIPDYSNIPSAVFSLPAMASVGISEEEAIQKKLDFRVKMIDQSNWPSSKRIGQKAAVSKVIIEEKTEQILGVHILGHNAAEVINTFALAIKFGHTTEELRTVLWAYPTHTSDMKYSFK
ncbi:NAD(P)/FAD-dependent oxidoreductase [Oceanispirochaeta crateris]|uniref:NAD(P)/FAD-dependent oxidoreductase n=1 Tax=Oceanispirochaeta crateris TaxID=2518645 RepID=A0A5C1QPL6_9SPIO|nr:NAD(P)/FAD-dependent oxidoreductase [Oceanispirochaeta crateris]QEN08960.1 NAD(P)/FAD-dependent oxidoreductase [Oceanispirochaeta crateris]